MTTAEITRTIDARGMACPGPLMSLIGAIREGQVGDVIEVLSSDEGSKTDIPAWVAEGAARAGRGRPRGRLRAVRRSGRRGDPRCRRGSWCWAEVSAARSSRTSSTRSSGMTRSVTVVDPTGMHDYQPGLPVRRARRGEGSLAHPRGAHAPAPRRRPRRSSGRSGSIPTPAPCSSSEAGACAYDYLVIATGARLVPEQIPGLAEGSLEFYSLRGRRAAARRSSHRFTGGRIKVGVAGIPYKCPPAPVEFTFMVDGVPARARASATGARSTLLVAAEPGVHDRERVDADPADHGASAASGSRRSSTSRPSTRRADVVESLEGEKQEYDLLVLVPPHKGRRS